MFIQQIQEIELTKFLTAKSFVLVDK